MSKNSDANSATESASQVKNISESVTKLNEQVPTFGDLLPESLRPYWQLTQDYPLIEGALVLVVFWTLAYLIRRYVITLVHRVTSRTKTELDDVVIEALKSPVFHSVLWFGLIVASKTAGLVSGPFQFITPLASSMIVLGLTRASLNISESLISALSNDTSRFKSFDVQSEPLLIISSKILLLLFAAYITLLIWGINPVGLLASAGIVGIAVGFAAKDTLANLFSGVFILADRPYKLGDYINLDSGERGQVTHIGIRSTRLLTRDDVEITIPNGVIGNAKVVNESGGSHKKMRIRLNVQCAYDADLEQVERVLLDLARSHADVCAFPEPRVRVRAFDASGINIQLMGWIEDPKDRGRVSHLLYKNIHQAFRDNGLEIPFPKQDVYLKNQ